MNCLYYSSILPFPKSGNQILARPKSYENPGTFFHILKHITPCDVSPPSFAMDWSGNLYVSMTEVKWLITSEDFWKSLQVMLYNYTVLPSKMFSVESKFSYLILVQKIFIFGTSVLFLHTCNIYLVFSYWVMNNI